MTNANGLSPAMEKLQKQLLDIQKIYQPIIAEQMSTINFEHIFAPLYDIQSKLIQSNISFALTQFTEQLERLNQEIQPIIPNITFASTELANKFAELHPYLEEQLFNMKELHYDDFSYEEAQEFEKLTTNFSQVSENIKDKKLTIESWLSIVGIIIAILAMYQSHVYHTEDAKSDEQFQTEIIQFLQEFGDKCCECAENHPSASENIQLPIHEI